MLMVMMLTRAAAMLHEFYSSQRPSGLLYILYKDFSDV